VRPTVWRIRVEDCAEAEALVVPNIPGLSRDQERRCTRLAGLLEADLDEGGSQAVTLMRRINGDLVEVPVRLIEMVRLHPRPEAVEARSAIIAERMKGL
jgi:hypothetical protein